MVSNNILTIIEILFQVEWKTTSVNTGRKGSRTLTHAHTWVSIAMIYNHSHLSHSELSICLQILTLNWSIGCSPHRRREKYDTVSCTHEISCIRAGQTRSRTSLRVEWQASARHDSVTELRDPWSIRVSLCFDFSYHARIAPRLTSNHETGLSPPHWSRSFSLPFVVLPSRFTRTSLSLS